MKLINYTSEDESWDEQREARRYNPATVLVIEGKRFTIGAGDSDSLTVFGDKEQVYVLAVNRWLDYCGIEVFNRDDESLNGDCFAQGDEEVRECLGPRGLDLTERTIAKRLLEYALQ